ncbi:PREDICTED: uncharacterized protein LOC106817812 [Priapulus caudatus]|uniref:Uncharacterized protein LOC106817812 n=1 Tax=Priapulus caudatus TaxID=37621 RepID=A0ABM1F0M8_PRICU|nr:PREDICTED: uncharacterized protein LOC106817812 [Priapulus caudatus]
MSDEGEVHSASEVNDGLVTANVATLAGHDTNSCPDFPTNTELSGVPNQDSLTSVRQRVPSDKFASWQTDQNKRNFRSAISAWRKGASRAELTLSESQDISALKRECERLGTLMNEVSHRFERYETLVVPEEHDMVCQRYDEIEKENLLLTRQLAGTIREIRGDSEDTQSRLSSKSRASGISNISRVSSVSRRLDAEADRAMLKAKLQHMVLEDQTRLELEQKKAEYLRAKTLTELGMAEARLETIVKEEEFSSPLPGEPTTSAENVIRYLQSQPKSPICSSFPVNDDGVGPTQVSATRQKGPAAAQHVPYNSQPSDSGARHVDSTLDANVKEWKPLEPKNDITAFAEALSASIGLSRLPVPEPPVFQGDPLEYPDWEASFAALIESRGIPVQERIHYLKRYLSGPAKEAVNGYFLLKSENAFEKAKSVLQKRYGSPFAVSEAFRRKLESWPRIQPRDGRGLQKFSDFLQQCEMAMADIESLTILNDNRENRKLLQKLPDWIVTRWGRLVSRERDSTGTYPKFSSFAKFLAEEAEIVCDPVVSLESLRSTQSLQGCERTTISRKSNGARSLATETKELRGSCETKNRGTTPTTVKEDIKRPVCSLCEKDHTLAACTDFHKKSMDEKREHIKQRKLCFGCLRKGHFTKDCRNRHTCWKCKKKHPTCLHEERGEGPQPIHEGSIEKTATNFNVRNTGTSTAMIVPVWVSSVNKPEAEILIYALLDTQSDTSFILDETSKALDVSRDPSRLKLNTMTSLNTVVQCDRVRGLQVRGYHSEDRLNIATAYTRDIIPVERASIPTSRTAKEWSHLATIAEEIPPLQNCEVGMLIGYDCPLAVAATSCITGTEEQPCGLKTILGWSIVGPGPPNAAQDVTGYCHRVSVKVIPAVSPSAVIKVLESDFSDSTTGDKVVSQEDLRFLEIMDEGIHRREDGHYEMPLPFKSHRPALPDNKRVAAVRLNHLKRKLIGNSKYLEDYKSFMDGIIERGDAELVCKDGVEGGRWYIPHHGVYNPNKPGKIRVVFDCSAKYQGESLNDHLLTGPDLINGLVGVLSRFRKFPVALMCDVEKMFHQFHVDNADRDYLRFLWWENGDINSEPREYRMTVHLFGAASSPGCANYGLKHIAEKHGKEFAEASRFILRNFYVDDGLGSVQSSAKAIQLVRDTREICSTGGLRLHKFLSNSREVLESIPESERVAGVKDVDLNQQELPVDRCLGIQWHVESDCFKFQIEARNQPLTRRGVLSTIASIYDPLGFIAPFVLVGKSILQGNVPEGCRLG